MSPAGVFSRPWAARVVGSGHQSMAPKGYFMTIAHPGAGDQPGLRERYGERDGRAGGSHGGGTDSLVPLREPGPA
jgi:hypothetical protein